MKEDRRMKLTKKVVRLQKQTNRSGKITHPRYSISIPLSIVREARLEHRQFLMVRYSKRKDRIIITKVSQ